MSKPYPALCKDCKYSKPEERSDWNLRCFHPIVNANDPWALAGAHGQGSSCHDTRMKGWFHPCGMRGALWEPKEVGC